jgi:hypothetical protein
VKQFPEPIESDAGVLLRLIFPTLKEIGEGGSRGCVDQIGIEGTKPTFDAAFEPGGSDRHVLQFDAQLQASQFEVPVKFYGIIHDEDFWNTEGQILVLGLEKVFHMRFGQNSIEQTVHDQTVRWRLEADKDSSWVSGGFITDSSDGWSSDRQAIIRVNHQHVDVGKIKFCALIGAFWAWTQV